MSWTGMPIGSVSFPKPRRRICLSCFSMLAGRISRSRVMAGQRCRPTSPWGSVLTAVDGVSINTYVRSLGDSMPLAKDYDRNLAILPQLYQDLAAKHTLGLVTPVGVSTKVVLKGVDPMTQERYQANVTTAVLEGGVVAYLEIRSLTHDGVVRDREVIRSFLKENRTTRTLIIDIRGNEGGDSNYWCRMWLLRSCALR